MTVIVCYKSDLLWHIFSITMTVIVCYKLDLLWHIFSMTMTVLICYKSDLLWHIFSMTMTVIVCYKSDLLWVRIPIGAKCTTLCDKVCQWLATGRWFSPGPPVPSTNKTDRHDITEILLKVTLNTIKPNQTAPINKCPQSLPVTMYFNGSLESKKLFYFVVEFEYFAKVVLKLEKLYMNM